MYGMAAWCWEPDDVVGRRLAAVQLVLTGAALPGEVARAFGVAYESLRRWRERYLQEGVEGLLERRRGPKGPIKLDEEMVARIRGLSKEGMGLRAIGRRVGVDPSTVRRALGGSGDKDVTPGDKDGGGGLVALARPPARTGERELARAGLLGGAEPLICEGSGLPFVGSLLVLPAVAGDRSYRGVRDALRSWAGRVLLGSFAGAHGGVLGGVGPAPGGGPDPLGPGRSGAADRLGPRP